MDFRTSIITKSPNETARVGKEVGDHVRRSAIEEQQKGKERRGASIVCLYGELGSGKTTFVRGIAKALGVTNRLLSPTFIIVRRYSLPKMPSFFYHIDLYRLANEEELAGIGIREILADPDSYVVIEWAEKMGNLLPASRVDVRLTVLPDGSRRIWMHSSKR